MLLLLPESLMQFLLGDYLQAFVGCWGGARDLERKAILLLKIGHHSVLM